MARALPPLVTVVGVVALTASLAVLGTTTTETPMVGAELEPWASPVLADVTGTGRPLVRGRRGAPYLEDDALVVGTSGPVALELLDSIRSTRTQEDLTCLLAFHDSGSWPRDLLYQEYRFTPDTGWVEIRGR